MSIAEEARAGVRAHPFLLEALRAGVLNYSAAARFLGIEDEAAGAAALRRFADELPAFEPADVPDRIRVTRGVGPIEDPAEAIVTVDDIALGEDAGEWTAIVAEGGQDARAIARGIARLWAADIDPVATGSDGDQLIVVIERADTANAIRCLEGDAPGSTH